MPDAPASSVGRSIKRVDQGGRARLRREQPVARAATNDKVALGSQMTEDEWLDKYCAEPLSPEVLRSVAEHVAYLREEPARRAAFIALARLRRA